MLESFEAFTLRAPPLQHLIELSSDCHLSPSDTALIAVLHGSGCYSSCVARGIICMVFVHPGAFHRPCRRDTSTRHPFREQQDTTPHVIAKDCLLEKHFDTVP